MRNLFYETAPCTTGELIRIIQHRAWEDYDESLDYEDLKLFLICGKAHMLTEDQKQFALDLSKEIEAANQKLTHSRYRLGVYRAAGLITGDSAYRRVFYPRDYDERFGGFGSVPDTPAWRSNRERWNNAFETLAAGSRS